MLQIKEQLETSNNQDCQFSQPDSQIQTCRHLQPSILNKSSIHSIAMTNNNIQHLPQLPPDIQKLDLSQNLLKGFPLGLRNLKEIRVNNNLIERIPQEINDMTSLRIIRANKNNICVLPFLKYVRHLELNNNPIKLITTKISSTRLQFLSFDWIPFLINTAFECPTQDIVYSLCDIIAQANIDPVQQFVGFHVLFQHRKLHYNDVSCPIHKAINKKADFFIDYLLNYQQNINYNALLYFDKPVLAEVFENNYEKALQLFKLRKSNLSYPQVYMINLILAIKYNNIDYFNYLVGTGLKRHIIIENQYEIIETIFRAFNEDKNSSEMLLKILRYSSFSASNKKVFHLPQSYSIVEAQRICDGLLYVFNHPELNQLFDFNPAIEEDTLEPLLHFAMTNKKPQLVKIILQRYRKPFVRNYAQKLARTIRGSVFSRKMVWKYQKMYIKELLQSKQKSQNEKKKLTGSTLKWSNIIYDEAMKTNCYNSPLRESKKQNESLISSKIRSIERSIQRKKMINKLAFERNQMNEVKQLEGSPSLSLNEEDQTGILFEYTLNLGNNRSASYFPPSIHKLHHTVNNLSLYETFQKSALSTVEKQYQRASPKQNKINRSFILSPLRICQDVEQNQFEKEYVIARQNNESFGSTCYSPCINVEEQMKISE